MAADSVFREKKTLFANFSGEKIVQLFAPKEFCNKQLVLNHSTQSHQNKIDLSKKYCLNLESYDRMTIAKVIKK